MAVDGDPGASSSAEEPAPAVPAVGTGSGTGGEERVPGVGALEDVDREAILRRRARFVASAMAGLVLGAGCEPAPPQACLSPPPMDPPPAGVDAGPAPSASEAPPQPCLEVPPQPCLRYAAPPATPGAASSAGPASSGSAAPPPLPTSTNPYPAPCLKVARPPGEKR